MSLVRNASIYNETHVRELADLHHAIHLLHRYEYRIDDHDRTAQAYMDCVVNSIKFDSAVTSILIHRQDAPITIWGKYSHERKSIISMISAQWIAEEKKAARKVCDLLFLQAFCDT
jgi:hypothetical protein